jgi:alkylation response protein AidB-like acyl-CoA dehydrogenase
MKPEKLPGGDAIRMAAQIASEVIGADARLVDQEARWPERGLRTLQRAGLGGLVVAKEHGGWGHGLEVLTKVCEAIGQQCASTAMCFGMHHVAAAVISAKATPQHREQFLKPIVDGRHLATLALSESGSGAHFYLPETRIESNPDGSLTVLGEKAFVTSGPHADSLVVSGAGPGDPLQPGEFSCIVIPKGAAGVSFGEPWAGMGMRGNCSQKLSLSNVRLPGAALLGEPGDQTWYAFQVVAPYFLAAMTGTYLGVAGRAVEEARQHMQQRQHRQTAASLSELSSLQVKLAQVWGRVAAARALAYSASRAYDNQEESALPALFSSKAEVADAAVYATNEALTLCGGIAYGANSVLSRLLRDARAAHVMSPTTQLLRTWTGRLLLEQPLLGD